MDKASRSDWKRHSVPYDFAADRGESLGELIDQAMEAFTSGETGAAPEPRPAFHNRSATLSRERKKTICVFDPERIELSTDQYTPGVLKVFGETILPGVMYKSVLASCRSTAHELVKQALERFGLPASDYTKFVLCEVFGKYELDEVNTPIDEAAKSDKWVRHFTLPLADKDKPLLLQKFRKPLDGYSRRYELHERTRVIDAADDDDTYGLNENARKILISKLRPGAIPRLDASGLGPNALRVDLKSMRQNAYTDSSDCESTSQGRSKPKKCSHEADTAFPMEHPFFLNIRGFDVKRDKTIYVIKFKRFNFGRPGGSVQKQVVNVPKFSLFAPDIDGVHCSFKVYKFKRNNGSKNPAGDRNNFFLELEPLTENIGLNGQKLQGKAFVKSGDILQIGMYYVFLFKDCSKGHDIPLTLPWLPLPSDVRGSSESEADSCDVKDVKLTLTSMEGESTTTDDSTDMSIAERICFAYTKEKEDELVRYICAIIQQQNTTQTYPLTVTYLFSMCIEHASRKFERRQLKHLFLRILFTVRENVGDSANALSGQFNCTLLDTSSSNGRDQKLERLLLWMSNCVQLLLYLRHTFQLPEVAPLSDRGSSASRDPGSTRKVDSAKHALGQLVTGLEETIMYCFQQCVYTVTKALHPVLPALLNSNPFSEANSENASMEEITRMFETLAEVTHAVMLHEAITRQLFTYLFFFTNTNIFNKLMKEGCSGEYYSWTVGVRIQANLSQLDDWATRNGLEDEFSQMFEHLLALTELLATSKNTLVKYQWPIVKTRYRPLTSGQLYHVLSNYQLGKPMPAIWTPTPDEMNDIRKEDDKQLALSAYPPFALPDGCGTVDLVRTPEDSSFWNHLRRLKSLYGNAEDDSDSGLSISNTPRDSCISTNGKPFYDESSESNDPTKATNDVTYERAPLSASAALILKQRSKIPIKNGASNTWPMPVPKPRNGVCKCAGKSDDIDMERGSLASDLMEEEQRINADTTLREPDEESPPKLAVVNAQPRICSKVSSSAVQTAIREGLKNRYQKKTQVNSNVANCSARTLPKTIHSRDRSNSIGATKVRSIQVKRSHGGHSFSVEDLPTRLLRHRPSASFEEAIERGYTSDVNRNQDSEFEAETFDTKSTPSDNKSKLPRPNHGVVRRHKSLLDGSCASTSSDEVFIHENSVDKFYTELQADAALKVLPVIKMATFRPIPTSENTAPRKLKSNTQKLVTVSFDAESRRSSLELTKNNLFVQSADDSYSDADDISDAQEAFPGDVFTEVNENTLAALKRHGSSLNVAPSSENSPRAATQQYDNINDVTDVADDNKNCPPSSFFSVSLQRDPSGLGLVLTDGLSLRPPGIYVRKILADTPAARNGRVQIGDRIVAVNGNSVIGKTYQSAINAMKESGDNVTLLMARDAESIASRMTILQL